MAERSEPRTSITLLKRLGQTPTDQSAWSDFVARYGRQIFGWCRLWGLQPSDAEDVTQNVMLTLAKRLPTFVYEPSGRFRNWLRTVVHHSLCDFLAARRKTTPGEGGDMDRLDSVEARQDLLQHLDAEFDRELLEIAAQRVRARIEPHTWESFRLTAIDGLSGADAAARLGISVATVFQAKNRVRKLLSEEVRELEAE